MSDRKVNRLSPADYVAMAEWIKAKKEEIEAGKWPLSRLAKSFQTFRGCEGMPSNNTIHQVCQSVGVTIPVRKIEEVKEPTTQYGKYQRPSKGGSWLMQTVPGLIESLANAKNGIANLLDLINRVETERKELTAQVANQSYLIESLSKTVLELAAKYADMNERRIKEYDDLHMRIRNLTASHMKASDRLEFLIKQIGGIGDV